MANKILYTFLAADALFVLGGGLLVAVAVISKAHISSGESLEKVAQMLLLSLCPLNGSSPDSCRLCLTSMVVAFYLICPFLAAIANAILVFIAFILSLPAIIYPDNRRWLKLHAWFVVASATFTLGLGLAVWFDTLRTRSNLGVVWEQQTPRVRSLLQQRVRIPKHIRRSKPGGLFRDPFERLAYKHSELNSFCHLVRLLRLPEQHVSAISGRRDMPDATDCSTKAGLRWPLLQLRE